MGIQKLWSMVRRGWLTMAVATAVGLALGLVVSLTQPVLYEATSTGYVVAGDSATVGDAFAASNLAADKANIYLPLVQSRSVAERIAEDLSLDSIDAIIGRLTASADGVVFSVSAEAGTPDEAAALADAAIRATSAEANALETLGLSGESTGQTIVRIVPVEQAVTPTTATSPTYARNLGLGGALGILVGVALLGARKTFDRRIRYAADIEEISGVSSLGVVPDSVELARGMGLVGSTGMAAESLRQIRTNLRYINVDAPAKSIVVTSSSEGEGKSTIAANIAALLADSGERTILIDADLRRPVQAKHFALDGAVGLSQLLAGTARLSEVLLPTDNENLWLLPAGRIPHNPADIVGSSQMKGLIANLGKTHMVIIDAPPLLPVADAALLAAAADGALVVVSAAGTKAEQLTVATRKLEQVGGLLLGVVLNRVAEKDMGAATFGEGYGSYTSSYYHVGENDSHRDLERGRRVTEPSRGDEAGSRADAPRRPVI